MAVLVSSVNAGLNVVQIRLEEMVGGHSKIIHSITLRMTLIPELGSFTENGIE